MDELAKIQVRRAMREARNTVGNAVRGKLGIEHAVIVTIDCYERCLRKFLELGGEDE